MGHPCGTVNCKRRYRGIVVTGVRTILLDPRRLPREALAESLNLDHGLEVAAATSDASSTLLQAERLQPDVVAISSVLNGQLAFICRELRERAATSRVLVLDGQPHEDALLHAIESGADGYSSGADGIQGLAISIRALARGETVVPPAMLGPLLRRLIERRREAATATERLVRLTPREREVLALIAEGLDQDGIATELVISPETARTHVQRVLRKLGVRSRVEAIALVSQSGIADRLERIVERSAS
jgi:two-component system, NarL family, response regulator DevR